MLFSGCLLPLQDDYLLNEISGLLANEEWRTTAQTSQKKNGAIKTGYQQVDL